MFFIYIYSDNFEHMFASWITPTTGVKKSIANSAVKYVYNFSRATFPGNNFSRATFPGNFTYSNIIKFGRKDFIAGENNIKSLRKKDLYKELG